MPFVIAENQEPRQLATVDRSGIPDLDLIWDFPPFMRDSYDILGTLRAIEGELTRLEIARQQMILSWFPATADGLLGLWEGILDLPVEPPQVTLIDRQNAVLAYMRRLKNEGTGLLWEQNITQLVGPNWSYQEHNNDDGASPDPYVIKILLPFGPPAHVPQTVTRTPAGGGHLDAGDYWYGVSAVTGFGETKISTPTKVTVSANAEVTVSWIVQDLYATSYRVYRGSSSSSLFLLGETPANSFLDDGTVALGVKQPPSLDTSGSTLSGVAARLVRDITPAHIDLEFGYTSGWLVGVSLIDIEDL